MTIYVQIRDGAVVNRIVADGLRPMDWFADGETWEENDEAQIGWAYDGKQLVPPPRGPKPDPGAVLVPYGSFRARWLPVELQAMFAAKGIDWRVEDYVTLASAQGHINLSGPTAAQAKALFVSLGVLTAERADAIFAEPV